MSSTKPFVFSSPFSHPKYLQELQQQKGSAFNNYLDNLALFTARGVLVGGLASLFLFKRRIYIAGLFAGLGAGMATNLAAGEFNKIEKKEMKINSYLED